MANKLEELEGNPPDQIIEKGHIYFLYRPKVALDHAEKMNDVQKMVLVLSPGLVKKDMAKTNLNTQQTSDEASNTAKKTEGECTIGGIEEQGEKPEEGDLDSVPSDRKKRSAPSGPEDIENHELPKYRSIVISKKKLPDTKKKERIWGYVNKTASSMKELHEVLDKSHYHTATMGERTVEPCRPMGEGIYAIVNHERHTHLVYVLKFPEQIGEIQKKFNIVKEGSYIVSIKNPEADNPPNLGLPDEEKTGFPERLQQKFKGRKWAPLDTTDFLEHESCEMVFIGATDQVHHENAEVDEYLREAVEADKLNWHQRDQGEEVHIIKKLKLSDETPTESLFGEWA
ncbi:hypothetical protein K7432_013198 [Basidiobolus ranarum]|uniref:Uncharacterized protein n=1 Tax=Basidiobolus ranarum TaxID=34480 RepID=A0ABR2VS38_9FUNG